MKLTKKQRIAISVVIFLLGFMLSSYRTIKENSREYRAHPGTYLLGAATANIIGAFGCYWLLGIQRKQHKWNIPFLKARSVDKSKKDDWAFEQAASELESGAMDKSVWARAFSECKGDESASKARYISTRVERLVSQVILHEQNKVDAQAESDESIMARRNAKWLLAGSTIASVIAFIYLVNRNSALVGTENTSVSLAVTAKKLTPEEKLAEAKRKAEGGDAYAQFNLGMIYANGEGVPKDAAKAMEWLQKAAAQGNAYAQFALGVYYDNGEGVPKDAAKAIEWFQKAAAQGHQMAQYNLGVMYYIGDEGVPKDEVRAYAWMNLAAAQGGEGTITLRNSIEKYLTATQRAEGQRLASNWKKGDTLKASGDNPSDLISSDGKSIR